METPSVRNLHQELTRKMKALDDKLMEEYEPNIRKIEQIRFDFFKQCVLDSKDTPQCFKKSQEYELRPRFEKWGGEL